MAYNKISLLPREKSTFIRHIVAMIFNGFAMSIFILNEAIAKKTLHASALEITLITMIFPVSIFFSIYWGHFLEKQRQTQKILLIWGLVFRFPLIIGAFFMKDAMIQIIVLLIYFFANSVILPAQNTIFRANYRMETRGRLFGYASSAQNLAIIIGSVLVGYLLDMNKDLYKVLYMVAGICGVLFVIFISSIKIPDREIGNSTAKIDSNKSVFEPIFAMFGIFKTNRRFFWFEFIYFFYGMAFMILLPAVPIFAIDVLHLNYTQYSFARGTLGYVGIVFFAPVMGVIMDKLLPIKFTGYTFMLIAMFPFILFLSPYIADYISPVYSLYFGYLIWGIALSGITVSWNLASIYFSEPNKENIYQSIHVTLTGVRGLFAPFLGYFLLKHSLKLNFLVATFLFFSAGVAMQYLYLMKKRKLV